jgi:hypothetical protein
LTSIGLHPVLCSFDRSMSKLLPSVLDFLSQRLKSIDVDSEFIVLRLLLSKRKLLFPCLLVPYFINYVSDLCELYFIPSTACCTTKILVNNRFVPTSLLVIVLDRFQLWTLVPFLELSLATHLDVICVLCMLVKIRRLRPSFLLLTVALNKFLFHRFKIRLTRY